MAEGQAVCPACGMGPVAAAAPPPPQPVGYASAPYPMQAPAQSSGTNGLAIDLRNAATAEESYLTDYDTYTNDLDSLATEGLQTSLGTQLILGYDGYDNYCLVGSYVGEDDWYLYDSQSGGLQSNSYGSSSEAEAACSYPAMAFAY
jgi:hypothetical protein